MNSAQVTEAAHWKSQTCCQFYAEKVAFAVATVVVVVVVAAGGGGGGGVLQ